MCIISCFLNTCSIVLFYLWIHLWWEGCYEAVWMNSWNCLKTVLKVSVCLEFGVQTRTVGSTEILDEKVEGFSASKWKVKFWFWTLRCMNQQNSVVAHTHHFCPVEIQQDPKALRSGVIPPIPASGSVTSLIWPITGGTGGWISTSSLPAPMMWQKILVTITSITLLTDVSLPM